MRYFFMAFRYWAGTIFLLTLFTALWGLFELSVFTIGISLIIFVVGTIFSFPIILPCMWLLRITARLPYEAGSKSCWFAVMLSLVYILFIFSHCALAGLSRSDYKEVLSFFSTIAIFIVTYLSKSDLKNLYKQQTNQQ